MLSEDILGRHPALEPVQNCVPRTHTASHTRLLLEKGRRQQQQEEEEEPTIIYKTTAFYYKVNLIFIHVYQITPGPGKEASTERGSVMLLLYGIAINRKLSLIYSIQNSP